MISRDDNSFCLHDWLGDTKGEVSDDFRIGNIAKDFSVYRPLGQTCW